MTHFHRRRILPTPRLAGVGLFIFAAACHHRPPAAAPAPVAPVPKPAPPEATAISSAATAVDAMHSRYAPSWFKTLTFVQKTTLYLPSGGDLVQTWYNALSLPGRMRVDTDRKSRGGVLYVGDSAFTFASGKRTSSDSRLYDLRVLAFDAYTQAPSRTQAQLRRLGYDLSKFHEGTWQGRPVYIIGAVRGDTTSEQFWLDRDRLVVVRIIGSGRQGRTDTHLTNYVQTGGGWVATEITQLVNGKRRIVEQYSDLRPNVSLNDDLFDPKSWSSAAHWASAPD
jgi:hypothetical protein